MPWLPSGVAGVGGRSLLHYTICYRNPKAELYNGDTLIKILSAGGCTPGTTTNGGYVTVKFADNSTDAYTFNRILVKRDPYTAPDGSSKNVILTIDISEGKTKTADKAISFAIWLTIATTGG